ncbi:MAG: hypothetical protein JWO84_519 [Parcubacteria group bacterium]|nr:hypothetical protein [Parcubacteria group bacterium]
MIEVTPISALAYTLAFSLIYYIGLCLYTRRIIEIELRKLTFYITVFCLFGVSGEILTNNLWQIVFSTPLWNYHLFPAHGGDISYFFFFIWGGLGYYRYLNDTAIHHFSPKEYLRPGLIMGAEAVVLELAYNGLFLLLFGSYVFYYLPANLGFFSHLSCLQVIPFYFLVGVCTSKLITDREELGYQRGFYSILAFYWMIILSLILF